MGKLKDAVALTKKYATFFKSRLSDGELHRWLISEKTYSQETIKRLFSQKTKIQPNHFETKKFALARKVAKLLSFVPTVRMVAITGSLAINNSKPGDDIDLFIITRPDTLWLTRLIVIPLVSLFFKRRLPAIASRLGGMRAGLSYKDSICTNLWLDESALAVPANKRNLYTAHEVLQALPIYDRGGVYRRFLLANKWTSIYLANAYKFASSSVSSPKLGEETPLRRGGEVITRTLNTLAFRLQYLYMKKRITHETVTLHSAYFHPRDLSRDLDTYLRV